MTQVVRLEHGLDLGRCEDAVASSQREDLHAARTAEHRHRAALSEGDVTADAAALLTLLTSNTVVTVLAGVPPLGVCPAGGGCTIASCSSAAGGCCWGQGRAACSATGVAGSCCAPADCSQADTHCSALQPMCFSSLAQRPGTVCSSNSCILHGHCLTSAPRVHDSGAKLWARDVEEGEGGYQTGRHMGSLTWFDTGAEGVLGCTTGPQMLLAGALPSGLCTTGGALATAGCISAVGCCCWEASWWRCSVRMLAAHCCGARVCSEQQWFSLQHQGASMHKPNALLMHLTASQVQSLDHVLRSSLCADGKQLTAEEVIIRRHDRQSCH